MNARLVRGAIVAIYAAFPLYGTFVVIAPRPPIPPLVPAAVAFAGIALVFGAQAICALDLIGKRVPRDVAIVAAAPGLATLVTALAGYDPLPGIGLAFLVLGFGAVFAATVIHADRALARSALDAMLASTIVAALLALAMLVLRRPAAIYAYDHGRAVGSFLNPNEFATFLLLALAVAACAVTLRERARRIAGWAALALGGTALALTYSRWALVAAACAVLAYALMARRTRVALVAAAVVGVAALAQGAAGAAHHAPVDADARRIAWTAGWNAFRLHPFAGVGALAFERVWEEVRPLDAPGARTPVAYDPHGIPQAFLAESGVIGFGTLVACLALLARMSARARRDGLPRSRARAEIILAGFVAVQIMVLLNTISIYFPLSLQGAALAFAVAANDVEDA